MADDEDIAALVVDNGSGMCKGMFFFSLLVGCRPVGRRVILVVSCLGDPPPPNFRRRVDVASVKFSFNNRTVSISKDNSLAKTTTHAEELYHRRQK